MTTFEGIRSKRPSFLNNIKDNKHLLFFPIEGYYNSCNLITSIFYYFMQKIDIKNLESPNNPIKKEIEADISPISWFLDILSFDCKDDGYPDLFFLNRLLAVFILIEYDESEYSYKFFYARYDPLAEFSMLINNLKSKTTNASLQKKLNLMTIILSYQDKNQKSLSHVSNIFNSKILPNLLPTNSELDQDICLISSKLEQQNSIILQPGTNDSTLNDTDKSGYFIFDNSDYQNNSGRSSNDNNIVIPYAAIVHGDSYLIFYTQIETLKNKTFHIKYFNTKQKKDPVFNAKYAYSVSFPSNDNSLLSCMFLDTRKLGKSCVYTDVNVYSQSTLYFKRQVAILYETLESHAVADWQKQIFKIIIYFLDTDDNSKNYGQSIRFFYETSLRIVSFITYLCEQPFKETAENIESLERAEYLILQVQSLWDMKLNRIPVIDAFSRVSILFLLATVRVTTQKSQVDNIFNSKKSIFDTLSFDKEKGKVEAILRSPEYLDFKDRDNVSQSDRLQTLGERYRTDISYERSASQLIRQFYLKTNDFMTFNPMLLDEIDKFIQENNIKVKRKKF